MTHFNVSWLDVGKLDMHDVGIALREWAEESKYAREQQAKEDAKGGKGPVIPKGLTEDDYAREDD